MMDLKRKNMKSRSELVGQVIAELVNLGLEHNPDAELIDIADDIVDHITTPALASAWTEGYAAGTEYADKVRYVEQHWWPEDDMDEPENPYELKAPA